MKLRRALGFAALGIGVAAATNVTLRRNAGELSAPLDGMQRTYRWRGMNVAYTETGDADDPDLVLLHGVNAAASSGEWRAVFDRLGEEYHVVAPDLPGFGNSDRPPLRYSATLYEDFVADFLAEFDEPTVVASSLVGAYVAAVADGLDLDRLALVCPTTRAGPADPTPWLRELVRLPLVGETAFNIVTSRPAIRYFNADHGYAHPDEVDEEWEAFEWRTAHQPNARFAPASFLAGYLNSEMDLATVLGDLDVPTTICWGREADLSTVADGTELAEAAERELVVFDDAKLLPHVERADAFATYLLSGDLPDDDSAVVEYDPDWSQDETAAAGTDAASSTGAMVDVTDSEAGRAEPSEAAVPETDDPDDVDGETGDEEEAEDEEAEGSEEAEDEEAEDSEEAEDEGVEANGGDEDAADADESTDDADES